ncbi:uncharacterized protein [Venturia canescens]|nr:uncharacterized protein LOC122406821 isoform X2 [Venturia canescens]XP_043269866.1 uncharacterized protein LOC122407603 isoform X2 [Venturia canescens]XP_043270849.1 uncharacterized protein LOC122408243 isoform X2 [Venturia canescens]XP_043272293.1 uncharacterized protein LOC122409105 isoform X2 [Venturia canescens]XP_043274505.1 uncharacterized protein LOC122410441 isoform X2 [Venturia canescens]XP_043275874.1 uncharacterized protein LOC122411254 isoform X2 [Venturia canescens]XP_04327761
MNHAKTEKHKKAVSLDKSAKTFEPLTSTFEPVLTEATKIAELKIAAFIAEHSSLQTVNHMIDILPQLDPSSHIISNLKLHRTKCSMLIKNVLGPCMLQELIQEIGDGPYSLIIDESTDLSTQKVLCIMLRFFSFEKREVVTTFYRLIKLIDADAKSVHSAIKLQLEQDGLKVENMVGIGVDGASVMVGKHNSVTALFKREIDDLIVMPCVCHSLHLCAEKASEMLPRPLEFLVRETHNWFSYSPKRLEKYKLLYETINGSGKPNKIQGLSGTRWLARSEAIDTILNQWEELQFLFSIAKSEDNCHMAAQLYNIMIRLPYKAFLIFLKYELKSVTQLNLLFQSDYVEPTKLLEDLFLMFKNLLQKLVVPSSLQKLTDSELINFDFQSCLMHTSAMYFGYEFHVIAQDIEPTELLDVKERCKKFLCTLAQEVQKRLPDNLSILKTMADLHPKIALSRMKPSLTGIIAKFQRTHLYGNKNETESEWNQLQNKSWPNTVNSVEFYSAVFVDYDSAGQKRFENIAKFSMALLTLPISNASVERAFSTYNVIKNKLRNKLSLEVLQSIMMVRFTLQRQSGSCVKFVPSARMLEMFNVSMYDFKNANNTQKQCDSVDVVDEIFDNYIGEI